MTLIAPRAHKHPVRAAFAIAANRASKVRLLLDNEAEDIALRNADALLDDVLEFIQKRRLKGLDAERLVEIAWAAREDAEPDRTLRLQLLRKALRNREEAMLEASAKLARAERI